MTNRIYTHASNLLSAPRESHNTYKIQMPGDGKYYMEMEQVDLLGESSKVISQAVEPHAEAVLMTQD